MKFVLFSIILLSSLESLAETFDGLDIQFTQISASQDHHCAIDVGGLLYCWGNNNLGQSISKEIGIIEYPRKVFDGQRKSGLINGEKVKKVSVGRERTCAITNSNLLYCTGRQHLGYSRQIPQERSGKVWNEAIGKINGAAITDVQTTNGTGSTCALTNEGKLYCWGANEQGQLGTGDKQYRFTATPILSNGLLDGQKINSFSVANALSCAITESGRLYCWGGAGHGALTRPGEIEGQSPAPHPMMITSQGKQDGLLNGKKVIKVMAYDNHSVCAINEDHELFCWGNYKGDWELNSNYEPVNLTYNAIFNPESEKIKDLCSRAACIITESNLLYPLTQSLKNDFNKHYKNIIRFYDNGRIDGDRVRSFEKDCAIAVNGTTRCFDPYWRNTIVLGGNNAAWPHEEAHGSQFASAKEISNKVKNFHYTYNSLFTLMKDGRLYHFNVNHKTFNNANEYSKKYQKTTTLNNSGMIDGQYVKEFSISTGRDGCIITEQGLLYCWNRNSKTPIKLGDGKLGGEKVRKISIGSEVKCALAESDQIYIWGDKPFFHNGLTETPSAIKVKDSQLKKDGIKDIICSGPYVISNSGLLYTIKFPNYQSIEKEPFLEKYNGTGTVDGKHVKNAWSTGAFIGRHFSYLIDEDGFLYEADGYGSFSKLKWDINDTIPGLVNNEKVEKVLSEQPCVITESKKLFCKDYHANGTTDIEQGFDQEGGVIDIQSNCALTQEGYIHCWELKDQTHNYNAPYHVTIGGEEVKKISTYRFEHFCAITNSGLLYCWGDNDVGQLGNNSNKKSLTPTKVYDSNGATGLLGGKTVKDVVVYSGTTCAINESDELFCWGQKISNWMHRNSEISLNPQIIPIDKVKSVSMGFDTSCAVTMRGQIFCWGRSNRRSISLTEQPKDLTSSFNLNFFESINSVMINGEDIYVQTTKGRLLARRFPLVIFDSPLMGKIPRCDGSNIEREDSALIELLKDVKIKEINKTQIIAESGDIFELDYTGCPTPAPKKTVSSLTGGNVTNEFPLNNGLCQKYSDGRLFCKTTSPILLNKMEHYKYEFSDGSIKSIDMIN